MNRFLIAIALVALGGCYTLPEYATTSATTANLRIVHTNPGSYFLFPYPADPMTCKAMAHMPQLGGDSKPDGFRAGMPGERAIGNDSFERRIDAGRVTSWAVNVLLDATAGYKSPTHFEDAAPAVCPLISFEPAPNANYELVVDVAPAKCGLTLYSIANRLDGRIERKEVPVTRNPTACAATQAYRRK